MTENKNWGYFADGTIHLICSSHNDIAWFDTPAATIAWRDERSITPALERMRKNETRPFLDGKCAVSTGIFGAPSRTQG